MLSEILQVEQRGSASWIIPLVYLGSFPWYLNLEGGELSGLRLKVGIGHTTDSVVIDPNGQ